jgi:hypothetical protein
VEVLLHSFLTTAIGGDEWLISHPDRYNLREEPWYPLNRKLVGPQSRSGLFRDEETFYPYQDSKPGPSSPCVGIYIIGGFDLWICMKYLYIIYAYIAKWHINLSSFTSQRYKFIVLNWFFVIGQFIKKFSRVSHTFLK